MTPQTASTHLPAWSTAACWQLRSRAATATSVSPSRTWRALKHHGPRARAGHLRVRTGKDPRCGKRACATTTSPTSGRQAGDRLQAQADRRQRRPRVTGWGAPRLADFGIPSGPELAAAALPPVHSTGRAAPPSWRQPGPALSPLLDSVGQTHPPAAPSTSPPRHCPFESFLGRARAPALYARYALLDVRVVEGSAPGEAPERGDAALLQNIGRSGRGRQRRSAPPSRRRPARMSLMISKVRSTRFGFSPSEGSSSRTA